ncbi:MAG: hypothetical protein S4CHLAM102_07260 [Chlamydiia bacterium]|nr:hypothetical protein [Chlamydiia bacterium]
MAIQVQSLQTIQCEMLTCQTRDPSSYAEFFEGASEMFLLYGLHKLAVLTIHFYGQSYQRYYEQFGEMPAQFLAATIRVISATSVLLLFPIGIVETLIRIPFLLGWILISDLDPNCNVCGGCVLLPALSCIESYYVARYNKPWRHVASEILLQLRAEEG